MAIVFTLIGLSVGTYTLAFMFRKFILPNEKIISSEKLNYTGLKPPAHDWLDEWINNHIESNLRTNNDNKAISKYQKCNEGSVFYLYYGDFLPRLNIIFNLSCLLLITEFIYFVPLAIASSITDDKILLLNIISFSIIACFSMIANVLTIVMEIKEADSFAFPFK